MVYRWRHSGKGYQLLVDLIVAVLLWAPLEFAWRRYLLHQNDIDLKFHFHEAGDVIVLLAYLGASLGKSVARTQAMSLTSKRMGAWQSVERALGYSAAVLEGWLGVCQFFWDQNRRCAQDRLAETSVVDVRSYRVLDEKYHSSGLGPTPK
jgi:hypothetical protein